MARRPLRTSYAVELKEAIDELIGPLDSEQWNVHGNALWTPEKLLAASALMSWHEAQTLTSRFENVRELLMAMYSGWRAPASYTGYTTALSRWMGSLLDHLKLLLQKRVRRMAGAKWRLAGWIVFAGDGSRFESPRTLANEKGLGCAGKNRTVPQVFHTTLLHLGTNALWDFRVGPGTASERRHLEEMSAALPAGSLIVADAGFAGYALCQRLRANDVSFLLRVGGNITLLSQQLGSRVHREGKVIWLWPKGHRSDPPLELRLLVLKKGRKQMFLITNVLDPARLTRRQAAEIYRRRWGIEVTYRSVKQTLNRANWLSRTPSTVLAEHQSTLLGFWILQVLNLEEIVQRRHDPREWSPAQSRDATRRIMRATLAAGTICLPSWRDQLAECIVDHYARSRPKQARDWPHKKREPPVKPPKIQQLSKQESNAGKQLLKNAA